MTHLTDETHDPKVESWLESANDPRTEFPIQNLPFGRFRRDESEAWRVGVAIGDAVLDLRGAGLIDHDDMARLLVMSRAERTQLRTGISRGLRRGSSNEAFRDALLEQSDVMLGLPCHIRNYSDFYIGIHHATTVGRLFRPDNPLLPNYKWVPIGYHGRASTIGVSSDAFRRPAGQLAPAESSSVPRFEPSGRLDYELEIGIIMGRPNARGERIAIDDAEDHLFGLTLFNDWSARDIQAWEYQPLGPFLSKSFASTVSPWMVTMEALAPFRRPFRRPAGDPQPLAYLDSESNRERGAIAVSLEVWLQTPAMRASGHQGERISQSSFLDGYWTAAQLAAHHTVNGCSIEPGDLLGSGTMSGERPNQGGSMLELTQGGKQSLALANGESRTFLQDGDTVVLRGYCEADGFRRIGFGECRGTVLPALA